MLWLLVNAGFRRRFRLIYRDIFNVTTTTFTLHYKFNHAIKYVFVYKNMKLLSTYYNKLINNITR